MDVLKEHDRKVKAVQKQVAGFYKLKQKVRIFRGGTNSTRSRDFDRSKSIDISQLNEVVEVNVKKQYVVVEPNVRMDQLVDATLKVGLIPLVVSEFPAITVGGAIQGAAGESSSFKWGGFHESAQEYEIVLGDGRKITASRAKNSDLYHEIPCSFGSLGVITLAKLSLIPALPLVELTYHPVNSFSQAVNSIKERTKSEKIYDFIDGIMFSKSSGVVMTGMFTNKTDLRKASFHKRRDEWFYIHAEKVVKKALPYKELVPIKDYLFRYDRGGFWMGREGVKYAHIPFSRATRFLLSPIFKTLGMYRFLHATRLGQQFLIQDICLPRENATIFLSFVDKNYGIYPLWLLPLKPSGAYSLSPTQLSTDLVINVGVWGILRKDHQTFVSLNKKLENKVFGLKGRKVLYAHAYYSKNMFWEIYDESQYTKLRKKYLAEVVFPDIYEKIRVTDRYSPSVIKGAWKMTKDIKVRKYKKTN